MPWFKVDDTLAWHEKTVQAGNAAMGLWVRAGSWSSQQLTEGFIPDQVAMSLGTRTEASRLVSARLWERVAGGYQFHEFLDRNPSRAQVEAERDAAKERQRRAREAARAKRQRDQEEGNVTRLSRR